MLSRMARSVENSAKLYLKHSNTIDFANNVIRLIVMQ